MWLFLVSSFIYFAGLTSGFIVYTAGSSTRGIKTQLPTAFLYSTLVIVLSSVTMFLAYRGAKSNLPGRQRLYLSFTIFLGILFFALQTRAWLELSDKGVMFSFNPNASQSFIYVFVWSHLAHIAMGIFLLVYSMVKGRLRPDPVRNLFRLEAVSIFWHFIDILWIYLYVFLLLNQ